MTRHDRQERIRGWDQARIGEAGVIVLGKNWLGTFTVWALSSLGVGRITWLGQSCPVAEAVANWLVASASPTTELVEQPCQAEFPDELAWAAGGARAEVFLGCAEGAAEQAAGREYARARGLAWFGGLASGGGWFGVDALPRPADEAADPVVAMALAALLADAAREAICPLHGGAVPQEGWLGLSRPPAPALSPVVQVGVGGIGTYAAVALAARGLPVELCDHDTVDLTNLNRQGLFTAEDASRSAPKAAVARRVLARWFPHARVSADVRRVDAGYIDLLREKEPRPAALLSAVDNANTRLVLQQVGRELGLPVIQGGTSSFAADCFTQGRAGPLLDEQMRGALSEAAGREALRRGRGACAVDPSYVVPGMLAGALLAHRCEQVLAAEDGQPLPPLLWRTGLLPVEQRSMKDVFHDELVAGPG